MRCHAAQKRKMAELWITFIITHPFFRPIKLSKKHLCPIYISILLAGDSVWTSHLYQSHRSTIFTDWREWLRFVNNCLQVVIISNLYYIQAESRWMAQKSPWTDDYANRKDSNPLKHWTRSKGKSSGWWFGIHEFYWFITKLKISPSKEREPPGRERRRGSVAQHNRLLGKPINNIISKLLSPITQSLCCDMGKERNIEDRLRQWREAKYLLGVW